MQTTEVLHTSFNASDIVSGGYRIFANIETNYTERFLTNNNVVKNITLYDKFKTGFPINNVNGAHPIAFYLNSSYEGKEIITTGTIVAVDGTVISHYPCDELFDTCYNSILYNSNNDNTFHNYCLTRNNPNNYHLTKVNENGSISVLHSFIFNNHESISGPFVSDLNDDGVEEILLVENSDIHKLHCFDNTGISLWDITLQETLYEPIVVRYPDGENYIILPTPHHIYKYDEGGQNPSTLYSALFGNTILPQVISTDICSNSLVDIIFIENNVNESLLVRLEDSNEETIILNWFVDQNSYSIISADIHNDGFQEILISDNSEDCVTILTNNFLNIVSFDIPNLNSPNLLIGDITGNGVNEIICDIYIGTNNKKRIQILSNYGINIDSYLLRCKSDWKYPFLDDLDSNGKLDLVFIEGHLESSKLCAFEFDNSGTDIGHNGYRGNIRNSGMFLQPGFTSRTDTYWYNNIILSQDMTILSNKSLHIQPGTNIVVNDSKSIDVYGDIF